LERNIARLPGVTAAKLNFGAATLKVWGSAAPETIIAETRRDGVIALTPGDSPAAPAPNRALVWGIVAGLLLSGGWLVSLTGGSSSLAIALFLTAIVTGGHATFRKALTSLVRLDFNMNVLMAVAVTGAVLIGEYAEGAVVAFLFSVSEALQAYTADRARRSIRSLMEMAPGRATIQRENQELELPVEEIRVGDVLLVRPGERIAMDGTVSRGSSTVNQAPITGESLPAAKYPGQPVFAGTINLHGALEVTVTRLVQDTTLARIIAMVEEAQARKAPAQAFVDRFAAVYTPVVIALAGMITVLPPLVAGLPWEPWIYRGLTLLVVACPCALVISTPVAIVSAIGNAARHGVLVKGGSYLEALAGLKVIAFDKTGTLTAGKPAVTDIIPAPHISTEYLLGLAAGLEKLSEHPLAAAVIWEARRLGVEPLTGDGNFEALAGQGARGRVNGHQLLLGSPTLFEAEGYELGAWSAELTSLASQGKTVILVGEAGADGPQVLGLIAAADTPRPEAAKTIHKLRETSIRHTVMLTGDHPGAAWAIAAGILVDDVRAGLLPGDKLNQIHQIRKAYGPVAMVGDGINDAPALAAADVGIAMGGAGTDAALETADLVLMSDDLSKLPFAVNLSRQTLRVIKQNIALALGLKLLAVALVFPGLLTLWLAILADMGASLLVTLNGMRLIGISPDQQKSCSSQHDQANQCTALN